jgi:hypothetical protein
MWSGVIQIGLVMALATLLTLDMLLPGGIVVGDQDLDTARTAAFTVLVLAQLFNAFNARSEQASAFRGVFDNRWLWAAVVLGLALQVAVVELPISEPCLRYGAARHGSVAAVCRDGQPGDVVQRTAQAPAARDDDHQGTLKVVETVLSCLPTTFFRIPSSWNSHSG